MNLSRRRFVQGAAATLLAAPLLRNPEPEVETPVHWETVPDPRMRWDHPDSDPIGDIRSAIQYVNCRCEPVTGWDSADAKDIWEAGGRFVPADPPIPYIVSGPVGLGSGFRWHPDATLTIPDGSTITGATLKLS